MIEEDNIKRSQWKMGLVEEFIQGKDGVVGRAKRRIINHQGLVEKTSTQIVSPGVAKRLGQRMLKNTGIAEK